MTSKSSNPFAQFAPPIRPQDDLRQRITDATRRDEVAAVSSVLPLADVGPQMREEVGQLAMGLVETLRAKRKRQSGGVEGLVQEYSLSSAEGVALMCLAEALLRIPDKATRDAFITDKIAQGDWSSHLGRGRSMFVNAATWGLVIKGTLVEKIDDRGLSRALKGLVSRAGEPVVRKGMDLAMRLMGSQFVCGQTIEKALDHARAYEAQGFTYSFDMLGEAATGADDAARYYEAYEKAIRAIGKRAAGRDIFASPGISIKLSALHPRYERAKAERVMAELLPRLTSLALLAKEQGIGLNVDAEEADRLELSLDLFESVALDPALADWDGLGFVVQAYGKRCPHVIDWLVDLARRSNRRIMVRLVKGAYWDSEIKIAQQAGLDGYPVYTRKVHTDAAYLACARKLLDAPAQIYPQFATHNAQALAAIYCMAGSEYAQGDYEFQCLHGMGEALYEEVVGDKKLARPCRIYAPVGTHETLLAYLVRRLLENGANTSFVNRIGDMNTSLEELVADPVAQIREDPFPGAPHASIAHPQGLFGKRPNSAGIDLSDENSLAILAGSLEGSAQVDWCAEPQIVGLQIDRKRQVVANPADLSDTVGQVHFALARDASHAVGKAADAQAQWALVPVARRAEILERAADLMQERMASLMGLAMREAGKSAANAISEVREAIDFLRYYAGQARDTFGPAQAPIGPVVCISPWNFPLAIFTGQVAAALVAGNTVLAKPAEETPLIAAQAVAILHEAGIAPEVLQFVPGAGDVGAALVAAPQVAGVMFTGSVEVARLIQRQLANRLLPSGAPIPFIAETGGLNAMIVDSSALAEQVVRDVIMSAFDSAGQRCSALRILCLQEEIADRTLAMLKGAMAELQIGNPARLAVDVGPVISAEAQRKIETHVEAMRAAGHAVTRCEVSPECKDGTFVAPTLVELDDITQLENEVFGPVLHVVRYRRDDMYGLVERINGQGYGLTFGLHTRLDGTMDAVTWQIHAGNLYINRNTIGAIVGSQPFGGCGLSGTGPKAGGPLYLGRLVQDPPPLPRGTADPVLAEFVSWLEAEGETSAADAAREYGARSGLNHRAELPGPVGERNIYELRPQGLVLLRYETKQGLYQQLAAVLASGNSAILDGEFELEGLPRAVAQRIAPSGSGPFHAALVEGEGALALGNTIEQNGLIVPVQAASSAKCADDMPAYQLHWLLEEVSTSIDTTAAGGNAGLMMIE